MHHPGVNNCVGGLGCFTPRGGTLVADNTFAAAGGQTYVKQTAYIYVRDDSKLAETMFAVGTYSCQGTGECQFATLTDAEDFCSAVDTCVAVLHHPGANNCAGGLGCFTP